MTAICVIGTELSARVQNVLIVAQVGRAARSSPSSRSSRSFAATRRPASIDPRLSWFSTRSRSTSFSALVRGLLIGVFIYWGWESAVNLTEETSDSTRAPGPRGGASARSSCS